jgi:glutamate racemase
MVSDIMNTTKHSPIGIFDSGIGGLTVLKQLKKRMPHEKIIYLGDTARVPYGIKSESTILKYSIANAEFLMRHNVKMIIIACNTSSAVATQHLNRMFDVPVVDVIRPGSEKAVQVTHNKRVGIIGTVSTIGSCAYQNEIKKLVNDIELFVKACPLFVQLAEEGWCDRDEDVVLGVAARYLSDMKKNDIDTMVLGCTHYPLLRDALQFYMGNRITLIDSADETARIVQKLLDEGGAASDNGTEAYTQYYLTDVSQRFQEIGKRFLGETLSDVHLVDI